MLGLGLVGLAFFSLLSVCSLGLRLNQQSMASIKAVQVADSEMGKAMVAVLYDLPAGTKANFWGSEHAFPATPLRTGVRQVGGDEFRFAICEQELAGVGSAPDNMVSRIDTYVWWREKGQPGSSLTSCTRLLNYGEDL
jgi:hypothetical protein